MKHSKQLTVLIALLLILLMFGIVFYLYLSTLGQTEVPVESDGTNSEVPSALSEVEVTARLEALRSTITNTTPEQSEEIKERLSAARQAEPDLTAEEQAASEAEIKARLEAVR